jgi:uncharacterized protein with HEPN domain
MQATDRVRLRHMLEAAREARAFTAGKERGDFDRDRLLQLGLTRLVEIIGEAAGQLSNEARQQHPAIPWSKITGMRNRLIHAYFAVNLDILWDTVTLELPILIGQLETLLSEEGAPPDR